MHATCKCQHIKAACLLPTTMSSKVPQFRNLCVGSIVVRNVKHVIVHDILWARTLSQGVRFLLVHCWRRTNSLSARLRSRLVQRLSHRTHPGVHDHTEPEDLGAMMQSSNDMLIKAGHSIKAAAPQPAATSSGTSPPPRKIPAEGKVTQCLLQSSAKHVHAKMLPQSCLQGHAIGKARQRIRMPVATLPLWNG